MPYLLEALLVQVARLKFRCLEEGAGIDLPFGTDAACSRRSTTDIQPRQLIAKGVKVEKRVSRQYIGMRPKPIRKLAILFTGRMQRAPDILPPSRRAQARDTQFGAKTRSNFVETVQFIEAIRCQNAIHGQAMVLGSKQFQPTQRPLENTLAAYAVICLRRTTIQADLKVKRLKLLEATRTLLCYQRPIGANAHHQATITTPFKHLPDARVDERLTTAKVNLEDLHLCQLIDKS